MAKISPKQLATMISEDPQKTATFIRKLLEGEHVRDPQEKKFLIGVLKALDRSGDGVSLISNLRTYIKDDLRAIRKGITALEKFIEVDEEAQELKDFLKKYDLLLLHYLKFVPEKREIKETVFVDEEEFGIETEEENVLEEKK